MAKKRKMRKHAFIFPITYKTHGTSWKVQKTKSRNAIQNEKMVVHCVFPFIGMDPDNKYYYIL